MAHRLKGRVQLLVERFGLTRAKLNEVRENDHKEKIALLAMLESVSREAAHMLDDLATREPIDARPALRAQATQTLHQADLFRAERIEIERLHG